MTIFDNGRALAVRQLAPIAEGGKGQIVTLTYTYVVEYDVEAGEAETVPYVQEGSGVEVGIKAERVNGTSILTGDSILKLSPVRTDGLDLVVPPDTAITTTVTLADGTQKTVARVERKAPSGLLIMLELQLRGGS